MPSQCRVKGCKSLTGLYKANSEIQRSKWKEALSFTGKGNNKDKPSTETDKKNVWVGLYNDTKKPGSDRGFRPGGGEIFRNKTLDIL